MSNDVRDEIRRLRKALGAVEQMASIHAPTQTSAKARSILQRIATHCTRTLEDAHG